MPAFKTPDFTERTAAARAAKERALELLRNKPAPDPEAVAARQAAEAAREEAAAERRAARQAAEVEAAEAKAAAKAVAAESEAAAPTPDRAPPSATDLKEARDARYAARKARKR